MCPHRRTTDVGRGLPIRRPVAFYRTNRIKFGCGNLPGALGLARTLRALVRATSQLEDTRGTAKTLSPYGLGFGRPPMTVHGPALPVGSRSQRNRTTNKTSVEVDVGLENQAMSVDSKS